MMRLLTIIILLAACACDDVGDAADDWAETEGFVEVRVLDPMVCYDQHTCSIETGVCPPPSIPACVSGAPLTCTEPFATCIVAFPGEDECPAGWVDACEQYP